MNLITQFLQDHKVMILDGAMATELEGKGLDLNDSLWSAKVLAERPDVIEQVHYEYFLAGADCAMTASYQATIDGFLKKGTPCSRRKVLSLTRCASPPKPGTGSGRTPKTGKGARIR